jgi:hypothetical protein
LNFNGGFLVTNLILLYLKISPVEGREIHKPSGYHTAATCYSEKKLLNNWVSAKEATELAWQSSTDNR